MGRNPKQGDGYSEKYKSSKSKPLQIPKPREGNKEKNNHSKSNPQKIPKQKKNQEEQLLIIASSVKYNNPQILSEKIDRKDENCYSEQILMNNPKIHPKRTALSREKTYHNNYIAMKSISKTAERHNPPQYFDYNPNRYPYYKNNNKNHKTEENKDFEEVKQKNDEKFYQNISKDTQLRSKTENSYLNEKKFCYSCLKHLKIDKFQTGTCEFHFYCGVCILELKNPINCMNCLKDFQKDKKIDRKIKLPPIEHDRRLDKEESSKVSSSKEFLNWPEKNNLSEKKDDFLEKNSKDSGFFKSKRFEKDSDLIELKDRNEVAKYSPDYNQRKAHQAVIKNETTKTHDPSKTYTVFNDVMSCDICSSNKEVKGFLCNHNICISCLVLTCCNQISSFFYQYHKKKDILYSQFNYFCAIENCSKVISVPTALVLNHLNFFLSCNDQKFLAFKNLQNETNDWIPFFDGLLYESIIK